MLEFDVNSSDKSARSGQLTVNGRKAKTPLFMPVATKGAVKTLTSEDLEELGVQAVISNMYHLLMAPGIEVIESAGGLHEFMNWDGVIFTDSGGFQMIRKDFDQDINDERLRFTSGGDEYEMTPRECVKNQWRLGPDVAMCLDHCPPYPADRGELEKSVRRTRKWAERCRREEMNLFGISQGGTVPELRRKSCRDMVDVGFQGYAVGGLSIGEPREEMYQMLEIADDVYPANKPRYLMGLGSPVELLESIERGVDIFDSAYPTRNARHRSVFTKKGRIDIRKSVHKQEYGPIDENCDCPTCKNYSRAYINHLCRAEELSWMRLTTVHNLHFLLELMRRARDAIEEERFEQFKRVFIDDYK